LMTGPEVRCSVTGGASDGGDTGAWETVDGCPGTGAGGGVAGAAGGGPAGVVGGVVGCAAPGAGVVGGAGGC